MTRRKPAPKKPRLPSQPERPPKPPRVQPKPSVALVVAVVLTAVLEVLDITIVAQKPRLAPFREAIGAKIAHLLNLPRGHVNVKATTTDHLGFIGRGEGICAMAIVLVSTT